MAFSLFFFQDTPCLLACLVHVYAHCEILLLYRGHQKKEEDSHFLVDKLELLLLMLIVRSTIINYITEIYTLAKPVFLVHLTIMGPHNVHK